MKWTIRLLSLLQVLFYLSLWLFNEDVRSGPTPAILFQALLTLALLAAWRWERTAGRLAMIGGLIFFLILIVGALANSQGSFMVALFASTLLALPYVALGWLFFQLGRRAELEAAGRAGQQTI
jgi:hypothetical protein